MMLHQGPRPGTSVFVVHANAVEGREEEFNEWYDSTHLDDLLAVPGVVGARRYRLSDAQYVPLTGFRYLALYEIEGDPAAAIAALKAALANGMEISGALADERFATMYELITDRTAASADEPVANTEEVERA